MYTISLWENNKLIGAEEWARRSIATGNPRLCLAKINAAGWRYSELMQTNVCDPYTYQVSKQAGWHMPSPREWE